MSNSCFCYFLFSFLITGSFLVKVMKESGTPTSTAKTAVRIAPKSQEHRRTAVPPPPAPSMSETNGFSENANENGNNQESEGVVPLIRCYKFVHSYFASFICLVVLHY